jgi:hypothetical protein
VSIGFVRHDSREVSVGMVSRPESLPPDFVLSVHGYNVGVGHIFAEFKANIYDYPIHYTVLLRSTG